MNPYLPRDIPDPEHWAERAACNQPNVDPELWFGDGEASRRAAWICNNACPVKVECLTDALSRPIAADHDGVWGGLTGDQRQQLRKRGVGMIGAPTTSETITEENRCAPEQRANAARDDLPHPMRPEGPRPS